MSMIIRQKAPTIISHQAPIIKSQQAPMIISQQALIFKNLVEFKLAAINTSSNL